MGKIYEKDIRVFLLDKQPEFLFLTHVHYDHCGATAYLKKVFPEMKIAASKRASEIVMRPNALKLITDLSANVLRLIDKMDTIENGLLMRDAFEVFVVDSIVHDGQIIHLDDGASVHIFWTPGHTRDMMSYYIPEKKVLIATESAGCMGHTGHIITEFLVDYDAYIRSLKTLSLLDVEVFCQGHHFVFTGEDVKKHFEGSIVAAEVFKNDVERLLTQESGSIDRVVSIIKSMEYDTNPGTKQPEKAYLINLGMRVAHLSERLGSIQNNFK